MMNSKFKNQLRMFAGLFLTYMGVYGTARIVERYEASDITGHILCGFAGLLIFEGLCLFVDGRTRKRNNEQDIKEHS